MSRRSLLTATVLLLTVLSVAGTADAAAPPPRPVVVLVGIAGLSAKDVSPLGTPALARLAADGASGVLVVRSVRDRTCPLDAWLTLSAGDRAAGPGECGPLPRVTPRQAGRTARPGQPTEYAVADWARLARDQASTGYGARLGLLRAKLGRESTCATAVGPGAAVALANARGIVSRYTPTFDPTVLSASASATGTSGGCPLTVVDAGGLPAGAGRQEVLRHADTLVAQVRANAGPRATVLVAGISDEPDGSETALRFAAAVGPDIDRSWLTSGSTRQNALVQLTDLPPTLTEQLGIGTEEGFVGSRWRTTTGESAHAPASASAALERLRAFDTTNDVIVRYGLWVFVALVGVQVVGYGLALLVLARTRRAVWHARAAKVALVAALVTGAAPCAAFLAGLLPWATSTLPVQSLILALAVLTGVLAYLAARSPQDPPWAAPTTLALLTAVVLGVDVMTGSHLQGNLVTPGDLPLVGGRFFGFGNVAFAIFATSMLVAAGGLAARRIQRRDRRSAVLIVLGMGLAAVFVDGWPGWGADFGGVLALVPGVAVLVAGVAGIRLNLRRAVLIAVAAVVAVSAVAVADWLRPAESRSHLGTFVQRVIEGEAAPVILRKADATLASVTYGGPLGWLGILGYLAIGALVLRPRWFRARALLDAYATWPTLAPTLQAVLVTGLVGFALNDSGVAVLAAILMAGVPLAVLGVVRSAALTAPTMPAEVETGTVEAGPDEPEAGPESVPKSGEEWAEEPVAEAAGGTDGDKDTDARRGTVGEPVEQTTEPSESPENSSVEPPATRVRENL